MVFSAGREKNTRRTSGVFKMTYIITEPCEGVCNTACVEVCPLDCIYPPRGFSFSAADKERMKALNEQLYIHPEECIDCGACQPECPVNAIYPDDEVPEKWQHFIAKNYQRFGSQVKHTSFVPRRSDFRFKFRKKSRVF